MNYPLMSRAVEAAVALAKETGGIEDVMLAVTRLLGIESANFSSFSPSEQKLRAFHACNHNESEIVRYQQYFHQLDPVVDSVRDAKAGGWISSSLNWHRSACEEFYVDFLKPQGIRHVHAFVLANDLTDVAGFGFQGDLDGESLSALVVASEMRLLFQLIVSNYRNRKLSLQLASERELARMQPDRECMLTLDVTGTICGGELPKWLEIDGPLKATRGRLAHKNAYEQTRFMTFLQAVALRGTTRELTLKGNWGEAYGIRGTRLETPFAARSDATSIVVRIERRNIFSAPAEQSLRDIFDLTAAEARLLRHILQGHELSTCAQLLGVTKNTVRKQLASIMSKTGCNRQSELVRLGELVR